MSTVVIMAGGTGGHVYPALAVGIALRRRGINVYWMGSGAGLEHRLAQGEGFEFDCILVKGLWGHGLIRWLTMPLWLTLALWQSCMIIFNRRPDLMLGMGGYVCGPGGIAAWLLRRPLVIHESNVIAGVTNRVLQHLASRVLTGAHNADIKKKVVFTGTPVRDQILLAAQAKQPFVADQRRQLRLLVMGGSQGARALNKALPAVLSSRFRQSGLKIVHQSGPQDYDEVTNAYLELAIDAEVVEFIEDMSSIYSWADIVVSRAGAMTIAEICAMGLAGVFVPFPHAARDHQRANAQSLADNGAAIVCLQGDDFELRLGDALASLIDDHSTIEDIAARAFNMAQIQATTAVVDNCLEVMEQ